MREFIIKKPEEGQRFDRYLEKLLPGAGKSFLYKMMRKKNITLNGGLAKGPEKLQEGDVIKVWFSEETFEHFSSGSEGSNSASINIKKSASKRMNNLQPSVLYESEHILIINKPAGLLSQKAEKDDFSVNEWVLCYLTEQGVYSKDTYGTFIPSAVNRLDRNTSGIILIGKTRTGSAYLSEILRQHNTQKTYQTFVCGEIKEPVGYTASLRKNANTNVSALSEVRSYNPAIRKEIPIITSEKEYIITEIYPLSYNSTYDVTYCNVRLITGKSHQIRAQLSEIGHPLLGDTKYGYKINHRSYSLLQKAIRQNDYPLSNGTLMQILHAAAITLPKCPFLSQSITVEAPLPLYAQIIRNEFN